MGLIILKLYEKNYYENLYERIESNRGIYGWSEIHTIILTFVD